MLSTGKKENPAAAAITETSRERRTQGSRDYFNLLGCKASSKTTDLEITLTEFKQVLGSAPAAAPDGHNALGTVCALGATKSCCRGLSEMWVLHCLFRHL